MHLGEGVLGGDGRVVAGPSPKDGIEVVDQVVLGVGAVLVNDVANLGLDSVLGFLTRSDDGLEAE